MNALSKDAIGRMADEEALERILSAAEHFYDILDGAPTWIVENYFPETYAWLERDLKAAV